MVYLAKGITDPRVEFCLPKKQVLTQILIKFQNSKSFDQTLTSKSWPNIHFITSPSLSSKILTKLQFQNFAWTSTLNSWPNLVLKVWTKFSFMTKLQLPKLHKTVVKTFLIINISNSNKLNKFWVGIFTSHTSHQSSLLNRSEWVSESVSESVSKCTMLLSQCKWVS